MVLKIAHLYPTLMNIYGDRGNLTTLIYRSKLRNIKVEINSISPGEVLNSNETDLIFGGGGQDRQQFLIAADLQKKKAVLQNLIGSGVPALLICGSYQLFGHYFKTATGKEIPGIGIFNLYTVASAKRKIGNVVVESSVDFKENPNSSARPNFIVGFENHSGNTFLDPQTQPLGKVVVGFGNNGSDQTEGAIYQNAFGSYLHGSLLPKNPHLADHLIYLALQKKYRLCSLPKIDDGLEWQAHQAAVNRAFRLKKRLGLFRF